jgi:hypothetical protein
VTASDVLPKVSEIDFQRQIVGYTKGRPSGIATILGWIHVHFRPARTKFGYRTPGVGEMAAGWPDLVLLRERDRRLIFAELKSPIGKVTYDQEMVMASLRTLAWTAAEYSLQPSIEVYIWRPSDLPQIAEILR